MPAVSLCFPSPQLKQFERLEQEVSRPIDHDLTNWTPAQPLAPGRTGGLGPSDRQLLLFYLVRYCWLRRQAALQRRLR